MTNEEKSHILKQGHAVGAQRERCVSCDHRLPGHAISCVVYQAPVAQTPRLVGADRNAPMVHFTDGMRPEEMSKGSAKKLDAGKAPVTAGFLNYFAHAIVAVAYVSEYGDRKYVPPGGEHYSLKWLEVEDGERRFADADGRHRLKRRMEGDYDFESSLAHLAHKAWNAMAELEYAIIHRGVEVRVGNEIKDGAPLAGTFKVVQL